MTNLGMALLYSALQLTLLGSLAALLYLFARRCGPAAAARVAALALGVFIVLPLTNLCPLPAWWSWSRFFESPAPASRAARRTRSEPPVAGENLLSPDAPADLQEDVEGHGIGFSRTRLREVLDMLVRSHAEGELSEGAWSNLVPMVFLSGVGLGLLRLVLGLWSVTRYRRRSQLLEDSALHDLLAVLQAAIGCRRSIAIRESPDLSAPATAGWRRPFILLPSDWRTWTEEERSAVLAHELAHIHRADYTVGLLSRISLVVNFYHPLAYWLAHCLHLQQELAADALGAECVGGRVKYLRGLAQLLLRQDDRPPRWPARAFLSSSGTLLRRIHMLRAHDGSSFRPLSRFAAAFFLVVLVLAAVGISALRGLAQQPQSNNHDTLRAVGMVDRNFDNLHPADVRIEVNEANTGSLIFGVGVNSNSGLTGSVALNERNFDATPSAADNARRPSFDLSYMSPDAAGVIAVRPAGFLRQPAVRPIIGLIDGAITEIDQQEFFFLDHPALSVKMIEQLILEIRFGHNDKAAKGSQNYLYLFPVAIRLEKDFDGKKLMRKRMPAAQEVHYRGETYHKGKLKSRYFTGELCYFIPDEHTIVFHPEKTMRRVLDARIDGTTYTVPADWHRVEQGLLAAVVDIRRASKSTKDLSSEVAPLFQNTASFVFGVDIKDALAVQAFAMCSDEKSAATLVEWAKALIAKEISEQTAVRDKKQGEKATSNPAPNSLADLLRNVRMRQQGPKVRLHTHVTIDWAAFGKMLEAGAPPSQ